MGNNCCKHHLNFERRSLENTKDKQIVFGSRVLVSNVIDPTQNRLKANSLFDVFDEYEIESYFDETQYFLDFQNFKQDEFLSHSYSNRDFESVQKIWYKIESDGVGSFSHITYSETESCLTPEIYYFYLNQKSQKKIIACENGELTVENVALSIKEDTILSINKAIYKSSNEGEKFQTFIYLCGLKRIGANNYIEFQKDLRFTSVSSNKMYINEFEEIKNECKINVNCARYYAYKGKFFRRSYSSINLNKSKREGLLNSCFTKLIGVLSDDILQDIVNFTFRFSEFNLLKWPDSSTKEIKQAFSQAISFFKHKGINFKELKQDSLTIVKNETKIEITKQESKLDPGNDADLPRNSLPLITSNLTSDLYKPIDDQLLSTIQLSSVFEIENKEKFENSDENEKGIHHNFNEECINKIQSDHNVKPSINVNTNDKISKDLHQSTNADIRNQADSLENVKRTILRDEEDLERKSENFNFALIKDPTVLFDFDLNLKGKFSKNPILSQNRTLEKNLENSKLNRQIDHTLKKDKN
jgi:hypothetical protein